LNKKISILTSALLLSNLSAETTASQSEPLKVHLELSYMNSSGNSETDTFSLKSDFSKKFDDTKSFKGKANGSLVTDDNGEETTNKFYIEGEYDHKLNSSFFGFIKTDYTADKFSGYDYKVNIGPGVGYKVSFNNKAHNLDFSLGIAYSQDQEKDKDDYETYSSANFGVKYAWKISPLSTLKQDLSVHQDFQDSDNYSGKSVSAFEHKLTDMVSLGVSYSIDYQNNAPAKDIDKIFLTSLIIDF
jgi:putative salt-induced outer membrane protein